MIEVLLYSRANCHLCDVAKEQIIQIQEEVKNEVQFSLEIKLIDGSADLESEYGEHVPVTLINGAPHDFWRINPERFKKELRRHQ